MIEMLNEAVKFINAQSPQTAINIIDQVQNGIQTQSGIVDKLLEENEDLRKVLNEKA